jgi:hypothetical protein
MAQLRYLFGLCLLLSRGKGVVRAFLVVFVGLMVNGLASSYDTVRCGLLGIILAAGGIWRSLHHLVLVSQEFPTVRGLVFQVFGTSALLSL